MSEREIGEILARLETIKEDVDLLRRRLIEGNGSPSIQTELDRVKNKTETLVKFSESCSSKTREAIETLTKKLTKFAIIGFLLLLISNASNGKDLINFILKLI